MGDRRQVREFIRKYRLRQVNARTLKGVLKEQGYTVVEFNGVCDREDVAELITSLGLTELAANVKNGFTYHSGKYRLVFVNEALNDEEKVIVLAHEEGHIWHGHMQCGNRVGNDVICEYEANEFAHYLLEYRNPYRKNVVRTAFACAVFVLLAGVFFQYAGRNDAVGADSTQEQRAQESSVVKKATSKGEGEVSENSKAQGTEEYYITKTGMKYHVRDCMYIRNKTDVRRMTEEEYESGEYEPCKACLPKKE